MSKHYHDVGDLRFLKEMGKLARPQNLAPGWGWIRLLAVRTAPFQENTASSSPWLWRARPNVLTEAHVKGAKAGRLTRGNRRELSDCSCLARWEWQRTAPWRCSVTTSCESRIESRPE